MTARAVSEAQAVALMVAAIRGYSEDEAEDRERFLATAARGRPEVPEEMGRRVELRAGDSEYPFTVYRTAPTVYRVDGDGFSLAATLAPAEGSGTRVSIGEGSWDVTWSEQQGETTLGVDGATFHVVRDDRGIVRAPAPAVVVSVAVQPGDRVDEGEVLVVLEAMKMEIAVTASVAGRVRRCFVRPNLQVGVGEPLVQVASAAPSESPRGDVEGLRALAQRTGPGREPSSCAAVVEEIRSLMLGFDVDPRSLRDLGTRWTSACADRSPEIERLGEELLELFADTAALTERVVGSDQDEGVAMRAQEEELLTYLRSLDATRGELSSEFLENLRRALSHHAVRSLARTTELDEGLYRVYRAVRGMQAQVPAIMAILDRRLDDVQSGGVSPTHRLYELLGRIVAASRVRARGVSDLAQELRYRAFDQPLLDGARREAYRRANAALEALESGVTGDRREARIRDLVDCPQPLKRLLVARMRAVEGQARADMLEALARRYYRIRDLTDLRASLSAGRAMFTATYPHDGTTVQLVGLEGVWEDLDATIGVAARAAALSEPGHDVVVDLYLWRKGPPEDADRAVERIGRALAGVAFDRSIRRIVVALSGPDAGLKTAGMEHFTFRPTADGYREERLYRGLHPMMGKRLDLWRLSNFRVERLPSTEDVYLFRAVAMENPKDERLFALAEVRDLTPVLDTAGRVAALPALELTLTEALEAIRLDQSHRPPNRRLQWNRVVLNLWPPLTLGSFELLGIIHKLAPLAEGLGLEKVLVRARVPDDRTGGLRDRVLHISNPVGREMALRFDDPAERPVRPLSGYRQKVVQTRQRGLTYPYEIVSMIAPPRGSGSRFPPGRFQELDLDAERTLRPVDRPFGENSANLVVGLITSFTSAYPEGMERVAILGDPSRSLGSLAEPECSRIIAALDLAERRRVPVEWFAVSAGAKISMTSGTENMDWIGRVLRRLIEFTQGGGEVNVVVCGINVGAQPYWNAEATMLMHTKGILVMTPDGAMVLTGKQALDYSGGVSAEDNVGIGGYDRVMGPNGQAQYWASDLDEACRILLRHYEHTYVRPGEVFPRVVPTTDPIDRDVSSSPHRTGGGASFQTVGEVLSPTANPGRKRPFDMRSVMRAVVDQDHPTLERWGGMKDAEIAVVWDAHLGGMPVCLLGIESRPIPRREVAPADGPEYWTAGTLFPVASKKIARAINAASGNRPVVVLANLSGFDGSPESLRNIQLEYGAEIGRAVVNFRGPMVFCVVGRYHGGAFVVFSRTLNEHLEIAAVEGSFASVIGGAPAAAVVFAREVDQRTSADPRVQSLEAALGEAPAAERPRRVAELAAMREAVRSEKLGEVAADFDGIHTIYRAKEMGSVDAIIPARRLRPYLVEAVQRGMRRYGAEHGSPAASATGPSQLLPTG